MKSNFKKLILCAAAMLSAQVVFAGQNMPSGCPDVKSIDQAGVTVAKTNNNKFWAAIAPANTYQTNRVWGFMVDRVEGESAKEVLAKVNSKLHDMVLTDASMSDQNGVPTYYCLYQHETDPGIVGLAVTPNTALTDDAVSYLKKRVATLRKKI